MNSSFACRVAFAICLALAAAFCGGSAECAQIPLPPPAPFGSPLELIDVLNLPRLKPFKTFQASGYDRDGGFYDSGNFVRTEPDGSWVLLDAEGAGCVSRLWTTAKRPLEIDVLVEVDGASWLRADREALFPSSSADPKAHPDFAPPLAGRSTPLACYSYVPIPFSRSCKISFRPRAPLGDRDWRTNSRGERIPHVYYQVGYRLLREGVAPVFPAHEERSRALAEVGGVWRQFTGAPAGPGEPPFPPGCTEGFVSAGVTAIPAGESRALTCLDGPALVTRLELEIPGLEPDERSRLRLQVQVDGEGSPGVDAPIDGYFAVGQGRLPAGGLLAGGRVLRPDRAALYSHLPLPFRRKAMFLLRNESSRVFRASWKSIHRRLDELPSDFAFLKARGFLFQDAPRGEDLLLLETRGRGHLVGCVLMDVGNMEGDERISVDGGPPSEYHGTGTEDYLNFAWGLGHRGAFPLHGLNAGSTASGGHVNGYRLCLPDVVPFEKSIRFTIEHGHGNEDRGRYRGVVFWYEQPQGGAAP